MVLNRPKNGNKRYGQCQKNVLENRTPARAFYDKWECKHLSTLNEQENKELIHDINVLTIYYNYIEQQLDISRRPYNPSFSFGQIVELSRLELKNK